MRTTRSGNSREKTNSEKDGGFLLESNGKIYFASSRACPKCNQKDTLLPSGIIIDGKMTCIMEPAIRAALPKSGISHTMTTSVRDAPITSGGLGVPNLYCRQHF
jgi:hypothetical protein